MCIQDGQESKLWEILLNKVTQNADSETSSGQQVNRSHLGRETAASGD